MPPKIPTVIDSSVTKGVVPTALLLHGSTSSELFRPPYKHHDSGLATSKDLVSQSTHICNIPTRIQTI